MQKFFQLLRYSIGASDEVPDITSDEEWHEIYEMAVMQSIIGVMFEGVQRLGVQDVKPPLPLLMDWVAAVEEIEDRNREVNREAVKLLAQLRQDGFEGCILKGQGNNLMYPNVYSRMSGDIDVWVRKEGKSKKDDVRGVIRYVKERNPKARALYHHIDYGEFDGIEVEMHYRPSFMNNLIHNGRMQRWIEEVADEQFRHEVELPDGVGKFCVPTRAFNRIYHLSHLSRHVFHEGIGLRQILDYFFLLRGGSSGLSVESLEQRKKSYEETLQHFGLWKIARAVMWVLHEVLGLEDECLIAPVDERLGKVLLSEIMQGGNFGQYDEQNIKANSPIKKNWQRIRRDFRMMRYFPSECLWEPVFRIWHFFWRVSMR